MHRRRSSEKGRVLGVLDETSGCGLLRWSGADFFRTPRRSGFASRHATETSDRRFRRDGRGRRGGGGGEGGGGQGRSGSNLGVPGNCGLATLGGGEGGESFGTSGLGTANNGGSGGGVVTARTDSLVPIAAFRGASVGFSHWMRVGG